MKQWKAVLGAVVALLVLAVAIPVSTASAQEVTPESEAAATATVTITEDEINSTFWVSNPANRNLSNVYVDLQSENGGQVTISALYTWRAARGGTKSATLAAVYAPRISNGRLIWDVVAITADGKPASAELVAQVNTHLSATWRRYIGSQVHPGRLTDVSISDDDITFTFETHL